jgi:ketosteroid isomerase-like protein
MSTVIATPSVAEQEKALNLIVLEGRILDAFDQFYAEDVVMQENNAAATAGKPANREREIQFLDSIEQFHGAQLLGSAAHGDRSYSEWLLDITFKGGVRVKLEQVAARRWRNGQITHERFYYNANNA